MQGRQSRIGWVGVLGVAALLGGTLPAGAQSLQMNFFLSVDGPGPSNFGAVIMADGHCHDQGYAAGFGDLVWKAYITGTAADGEAGEVARNRIGMGPWFNYHGVLIAESLDQLHSDAANLTRETAVSVHGAQPPESVVVPRGSQLDGTTVSRTGPILCFGTR